MDTNVVSAERRALIIEDETLIAEDLEERLSSLGFSVIASVDSAEEGVTIAIQERPELILMDIRLTGEKDGVQAAEEIRQQIDVPIVYLTAYSDKVTVERAKRTDHDGFILKPFQHRELQTTIEVAMQRHDLRAKKN
jgi:CheY-like chemotaxis protein